MATTNNITGDSLITKAPTDAYRNNWDNIFKKKGQIAQEVIAEPIKPETSESIAADCYWHIAEIINTEECWSVQEHVEWMRELLVDCQAMLGDEPHPRNGGSVPLYELQRRIKMCLDGKAPGYLKPIWECGFIDE